MLRICMQALRWAGRDALRASGVDVSCAIDAEVSDQAASDIWFAIGGNAELATDTVVNPSYDPSDGATGIVVLGVTDEQI